MTASTLPPIPPKRYFTISEVAALCAVKPYVLRFWEQEFSQLKPAKRKGNRRYYLVDEVMLVRRIRALLYDQGFTIAGARNQLAESGVSAPSEPAPAAALAPTAAARVWLPSARAAAGGLAVRSHALQAMGGGRASSSHVPTVEGAMALQASHAQPASVQPLSWADCRRELMALRDLLAG